MSKLIYISLFASMLAACAVEAEPTEEPILGETGIVPIPDELVLETPGGQGDIAPLYFSGRKCVDQSYASAVRVSCELIPYCTNNWNSQLSRNHPVAWNQDCGGDYVKIRSLWTGLCYIVRKDALRSC